MSRIVSFVAVLMFGLVPVAAAQPLPIVPNVEPQPFIAQTMRLVEALEFLGNDLPAGERQRLDALRDAAPTQTAVEEIQRILDRYVLAMVQINPEARVSVVRGPAPAEIVQHGWKATLVKVHNQGAVRGRLEVESPNADPALFRSTGAPRAGDDTRITPGQLANRFLELVMYRRRPMLPNLSRLPLEYAILQINSKAAGQREARMGFHVGPGTQDLGFRNAVDILFDCRPSVQVVLRVADHDGTPTMASFVITDGVERLGAEDDIWPDNYRFTMARRRAFEEGGPVADPSVRDADRTPGPGRLVGVYPLPSRRAAMTDPFPDFYFHAQIYRSDAPPTTVPRDREPQTRTDERRPRPEKGRWKNTTVRGRLQEVWRLRQRFFNKKRDAAAAPMSVHGTPWRPRWSTTMCVSAKEPRECSA